MGRPLKQPALTEEQITELAALGCTDSEIATLARLGERTLQDRFRTPLNQGRARLRESLRRKQVDRALNGSDTMLIWLGKQYLDQRDKQDVVADVVTTQKGYVTREGSPDAWDDAPTE